MGNTLKQIRRKIELFFRGEFYLHLVTMFLFQAIVFIVTSNLFVNFSIPIILGFLKEKLDMKEGKKFSISDFIGTLVGGYLFILIYYLINKI